ncbi:hypothetical protein B0T20DRAFT_440301 [Sordaria brevicollis]|uniref:Nicotinamide-nucleotide adenylyltransferase n=1 Tax=Sordaria brevicollis TaxID=83679 RepID=A0AAE0PBJ8_SORBR|nr:hypothetical protein B0T20DRAFT_440301 [Sordaria brevicollis]
MTNDDMLQHSLKAQSLLLPNAASRRPLTDFFSRALSAFQSSSDSAQKFQVICTAPLSFSSNHAPSASAATAVANGAQGKPYPEVPPAPIPPAKRPHTLIVLDSSFNPPTLAHLRMATSAVEDIIRRKGSGETDIEGLRLLLLLAVVNADKAPKPASFDQRLAMMWAFARDVQHALRGEEDELPEVLASGPGPKPQITNNEEKEGPKGLDITVDIALTAKPFFHEKSRAMAESEFYHAPSPGQEDTMEQVILAGYDTLIRIFNPKYYGPPTSPSQLIKPRHKHDPTREGTPMQQALDPFFKRAKLRVTTRTDDEWGGKEEQLKYLEGLMGEQGLENMGGSKEWASRIEMVEGRKDGEEIVSSTYARKAAEREEWGKLGRLVSPGVGKWIEGERLYVVDVKAGGVD